jgi:hypothetical protein
MTTPLLCPLCHLSVILEVERFTDVNNAPVHQSCLEIDLIAAAKHPRFHLFRP